MATRNYFLTLAEPCINHNIDASDEVYDADDYPDYLFDDLNYFFDEEEVADASDVVNDAYESDNLA